MADHLSVRCFADSSCAILIILILGNVHGLTMQMILVALGGAAGSMLRFILARTFNPGVDSAQMTMGFPFGTLMVNVIGCFLIGVVYVLMLQIGDPLSAERWRGVLVIGMLGGFTTFSAFSLETIHLLHLGFWQQALLNIIMSVVLCLAGTAAGLFLARVVTQA